MIVHPIKEDFAYSPHSQPIRESKTRCERGGDRPQKTLKQAQLIIWVNRVFVLGFVILSLRDSTLQAQGTKREEECPSLQPVANGTTSPGMRAPLLQGSLLRVTTTEPLRWADWRSGSWMEAEFRHPVYSGEQIVIPAKSRLIFEIDQIHLARDHSQRHRPRPSTIEELLQSVFQKEQSHRVTLRRAAVVSPSGSVTPVLASIVSAGDRRQVEPSKDQGKSISPTGVQEQATPAFKHNRHTGLILKLEKEAVFPASLSALTHARKDPDGALKIKAGTQARLMLLAELSAFANRDGDSFQARLVEPICLEDGGTIPEGALFEGRITRRVPPRCLNRGGKLRFSFVRLSLPSGYTTTISASLSGSESDGKSPLTLDSEGSVSAGKQGKAAVILNVGTSWLLGKLVDDLVEEGFKWSVQAVASGSTAAAARYVGMGVGVALIVLQHGQDAQLPQYAELEVTFNRSITLNPTQTQLETVLPTGSRSVEPGKPVSPRTAEEVKSD